MEITENQKMHEIIEIKVMLPNDGLQLEDIVLRLISDLQILSKLPALVTLNEADLKVRRYISVKHRGGRISEYRVEDHFIAPNGTGYSFDDSRRNFSLEEIDSMSTT